MVLLVLIVVLRVRLFLCSLICLLLLPLLLQHTLKQRLVHAFDFDLLEHEPLADVLVQALADQVLILLVRLQDINVDGLGLSV